MKYIYVLLLIIPSVASANFTDVPTHHQFYEAIHWAQENGIVSGYSDGSFKADTLINRAEFLKIILESIYSSAEIQDAVFFDTHGFTDVPEHAWFERYVLFGWQKGIIAGYADKTFKPATTINFAEAAKIIVSLQNKNLAPQGTDWFETYVRELIAKQAVPHTITSFDHLLTRGDMVEILWRYIKNPTGKTSPTYESLGWLQGPQTIFKDDILTFAYPAAWPAVQKNGSRIDFGPNCEQCAEGETVRMMNVQHIPITQANIKIQQVYDMSKDINSGYQVQVQSDTTIGGKRILVWAEGGMCGYAHAYIIQHNKAVYISGFCLDESPLYSTLLQKISESVVLNATNADATRADIVFDGCGTLESYSKEGWYTSLLRQVNDIALVTEGATVTETCNGLNEDIVILIVNGGYGHNGAVYKYSKYLNMLVAANFTNKNEVQSEWSLIVNEFGKRSGDTIPVSGLVGDAGCYTTYYYSYNFINNTIALEKSLAECIDDTNGDWKYY